MKAFWKNLIADERPLHTRILLSALVSFSLVFSFILFAILDLYLTNMGMYPFGFWTLLWPTLLLSLGCFLVLTVVLSLMKGKLLNIVLSLLVGGLLIGYIQGNFLNLNLGQMTGDAVQWDRYIVHGIVDLLVWILFLFLPVLLCLFQKRIWKKVVLIVPVLLIGMQLTGLVSTLLTADIQPGDNIQREEPPAAYLSEAGMLEVSSQKNVMVFILDRLDGKYIDEVEEDDSAFFSSLDGFTYYDNHTSLYCRTYPSVPYLLSGSVSYFDRPANEYFHDAYQNSPFLKTLKKNQYTTKFYMSDYYAYGNLSDLEGVADNIYHEELNTSIDKVGMLQKMAQFSAYRYMPHLFKQYFWFSSDTFDNLVVVHNETKPYKTDDLHFYNELKNKKLTIQDESNNFIYLHLNGCHAPYIMNEYVESEEDATLVQQTKGAFRILQEYMNQMKELGVYDDATIIITGDHGKSEDVGPLSTYKTTGLFVKPAGSHGEALKISNKPVSHENFEATILQDAGIPHENFGRSIWEIGENEDIVRRFLYQVTGDEHRLEEWEIRGNANNFDNWRHVKDHPLEYNH